MKRFFQSLTAYQEKSAFINIKLWFITDHNVSSTGRA